MRRYQSIVESCCFCSARLNPSAGPEGKTVPDGPTIPKFSVGASPKTNGSLALQPEWRREVSHRLRSYRERHGHSGLGNTQTALEFEESENEAHIDDQLAEYRSQSHANHPSAGTAAARAPERTPELDPQINYDSHFDHEFDEATDPAVALDEDQYEDPLQATLAAAAARVAADAASPVTPKKQEAFQHLLIDVSRPPDVEI